MRKNPYSNWYDKFLYKIVPEQDAYNGTETFQIYVRMSWWWKWKPASEVCLENERLLGIRMDDRVKSVLDTIEDANSHLAMFQRVMVRGYIKRLEIKGKTIKGDLSKEWFEKSL